MSCLQWKRVYPPWLNGFDPVVVAPHETVSFYVTNVGNSYGILGRRTGSRYNYYKNSWGALDASSPVGAMKMGKSPVKDTCLIRVISIHLYLKLNTQSAISIQATEDVVNEARCSSHAVAGMADTESTAA